MSDQLRHIGHRMFEVLAERIEQREFKCAACGVALAAAVIIGNRRQPPQDRGVVR